MNGHPAERTERWKRKTEDNTFIAHQEICLEVFAQPVAADSFGRLRSADKCEAREAALAMAAAGLVGGRTVGSPLAPDCGGPCPPGFLAVTFLVSVKALSQFSTDPLDRKCILPSLPPCFLLL